MGYDKRKAVPSLNLLCTLPKDRRVEQKHGLLELLDKLGESFRNRLSLRPVCDHDGVHPLGHRVLRDHRRDSVEVWLSVEFSEAGDVTGPRSIILIRIQKKKM